MKLIYLDYAATSPVKLEVLKAMEPYFREKFGNPSSVHVFGQEARTAVDKARAEVAAFLNCKSEEVIFTSGGTESDNLALRGVVANFQITNDKCQINSKFKISNSKFKPHIITSQFEHHAVLHTCQDLERQGIAEVTYLKPNKEGIIQVENVKKAIKESTVLVSIMYVNNEIGTIQPIAEIAKVISNYKSQVISGKLYFHTDAVQAIGYCDCDVTRLGVDLLSMSAHKFGGPKGVGVLYIKKDTPIHAVQTGGAQEFRLRAGTENVAGIVGLGKAISLIKKPKANNQKLILLRDHLIDSILKEIPDTIVNGSRSYRSPNNVNITFKYIEGESILLNLNLKGVAASTGSACSSGSLDPSHVLLSIGQRAEEAHGSIRFTLGGETTEKDINYLIRILPPIIKKLRYLSPFGKNNK